MPLLTIDEGDVQQIDTPTQGGSQQIKFGKESEVYRLVMRSKLPDAEKFQDWVCEDEVPKLDLGGKSGETNFVFQEESLQVDE